jgi:cytochrome b subunit of formate dehydrogenase
MSHSTTQYPRFDRWQRIEHGFLIFSFTALAVTGLPQKYSATLWGSTAIGLMGGIETTRLLHRGAAIILMALTIYHFVAVAYRIFVARVRMTMLPSWQDVKDGIQALGYNLHLATQPPRMGRYNFGEKVEYWAVIWGTVIMIITGFMLWNPIATAHLLPGQLIPASKAAHGGEALLAVLSIVTWHLYNVHIKHFNRSMFSGNISHHEMESEHAQELADMAAMPKHTPSPAEQARLERRRRVFIPIAAVISLGLLIGLYYFVTFESTAIETVPRQSIEVFTPPS